MRRLLFAALVVLAAVGCAPSETTSEDRAHAIGSQVWSPYCPGRLLNDCTTTQARELRVEIGERVEAGQGDDEILRWVRSEFGPEAIARPARSPGGLVVWLVPAAIFAIGAIIVARAVVKWRRTTLMDPKPRGGS